MQYSSTITLRAGSLVLWDVFVNTIRAGTVGNQLSVESDNNYGAVDSDGNPLSDTNTKGQAADSIIQNFIINPPGS